MVRDGVPYVVVPALLAMGFMGFGLWSAWFVIGAVLMLMLMAFMAYFFRNPRRSIPLEPGIVLAPADGKVTIARQATPENSEALVSIFLSPFDVHINRAPIEGEIVDISYKKGKFLMATKEASRLLNEQNCLTIVGSDITVKCVQIAGVLARRIVCWKQRGERVKCGEQFGMIKFSSRTDLLMPSNVEVMVKVGSRVKGGETISDESRIERQKIPDWTKTRTGAFAGRPQGSQEGRVPRTVVLYRPQHPGRVLFVDDDDERVSLSSVRPGRVHEDASGQCRNRHWPGVRLRHPRRQDRADDQDCH